MSEVVEIEKDEINLSEVFSEILSKNDSRLLKEFLDEQNISDVVELVNEFPEQEANIIDHMTVHRAVSVFKILDINWVWSRLLITSGATALYTPSHSFSIAKR